MTANHGEKAQKKGGKRHEARRSEMERKTVNEIETKRKREMNSQK